MKFDDGWLTCDRDNPAHISLGQPAEVPGNIRSNLNIRNPLIEQRADPWCLRQIDGKYYFTATVCEYDWEKIGYWVNEGPAVLIRKGRVFVRNPDRHTRVQRFNWDSNGTPDLGEPVSDDL